VRGEMGRVPRGDDLIATVAHRVGIETDLFPRKPDQLSAGQKQKVAVGRALAPLLTSRSATATPGDSASVLPRA